MNLLITYGGTSEPIDNVRYITNFSTGETGYSIAQYLKQQDLSVTTLCARSARGFAGSKRFFTYEDLQNHLYHELRNHSYDVVIHAAAVSDYLIDEVKTAEGNKGLSSGGKLKSGQNLVLKLKPSKKILSQLREHSKNKNICIIAFKLTDNASLEEREASVARVFDDGANYVVHNDLNAIHHKVHKGSIYDHKQHICNEFHSKEELAKNLFHIIQEQS
tara:strand:- start:9316 stop:9969 length:654 start_codon:yes stop_codon:yes gene_type:complete